MTKKQLKKIALLYAANVVYNAMTAGASSELLTEEENETLFKYVKEISFKMLRGNIDSLKYGSLDALIKQVQSKK